LWGSWEGGGGGGVVGGGICAFSNIWQYYKYVTLEIKRRHET